MQAVLFTSLFVGAAILIGHNQDPPLETGEVRLIELRGDDAFPEGSGPSRTFAYESDFEGKAYVWARAAEDFDLILRAETGGGMEIGRDESDDRMRSAFLSLDVQPGRTLSIELAAANPDASGSVELHVVAAPETEATRAAAVRAEQAMVELSRLRAEGRATEALELLVRTLEEVSETEAAELSSRVESVMLRLGLTAYELGDARAAESALRHSLELRERCLPEDHPVVRAALRNLATVLHDVGDLAASRELAERALERYSAILPEEDPEVQHTRLVLATTLGTQGDLEGARHLQEGAVEVLSTTLPDDHPLLQQARQNLANTLGDLGQLQAARDLNERIFEIRTRTLPEDHPDLQQARGNLAVALSELGEFEAAWELESQVLEVYTRTLPDDHPSLQAARVNLAVTLGYFGHLERARALQEKVLEVLTEKLPADHFDLQPVRVGLAITLFDQGQRAAARELQEQVLEVYSKRLPDDHPALQNIRQGLAITLHALGDRAAARELREKALEVLSRTLPDDHSDLQRARGNLALSLHSLRDYRAARELEEKVVEVFSATRPEDDPELQLARGVLADTLKGLGEWAAARDLEEQVLAVLTRTYPEDHPRVHMARFHLAETLAYQGEFATARDLGVQAFEALRSTFPEGHEFLQQARVTLARIHAVLGEEEIAAATAAELARIHHHSVAAWISSAPPREIEERASAHAWVVDALMSLAQGAGSFDPIPALEREAFELVESVRSAGLDGARLARAATGDPRLEELREQVRAESVRLARLVRSGTDRDALVEVRGRMERAQRKLAESVAATPAGVARSPRPDLDALSDMVGADEALVSTWRCARLALAEEGLAHSNEEDVLVAFVVRADGSLSSTDLGPVDVIEESVRAWRAAVLAPLERGVGLQVGDESVRERGEALRRLVFDPLAPRLEGVRRVIFVPDDVLHMVALDALPFESGVLGEVLRVEVRATLKELLCASPKPAGGGALLALGGASFNSRPDVGESQAHSPAAPASTDASGAVAAVLRGSPWERGFDPLPYTAPEARSIAALHEESLGGDARILEKRGASRAALEQLAPGARWLHVATHGWYAPESVRSSADREPLDRWTGLGRAMSREEQVRGSSPMVLCGLALAGANLPADALGRIPGLITAEELATLDLGECELAVLSACDTSVGVHRAGQGVASLQKALHMAGARSVITSLWKVPDEATRELMVDFYRRLWVQRKNKDQALWEAKMRIRDARDERGDPRFGTRDWAGWVLTGSTD